MIYTYFDEKYILFVHIIVVTTGATLHEDASFSAVMLRCRQRLCRCFSHSLMHSLIT